MRPENVIEVHNVNKKFKVFVDKGRTLKELTLFSKRRKFEERKVLQGINFNVKRGEAVGLIGQNGCGKSTTLKLLTKIMYPDSGIIEMKGRVSSLIELGAGFHPDISGRQNIYTNASIFGLTKKEIDSRLEDIIAFSELEEFIDNPVRTYSSGMYMRLAFAVAINVDADILLIDEILAVGDGNFQAKCFNRLREIKAKGTTIVIVSHSLGQIEQICDRSIWIHNGKIRDDGPTYDVHAQYLKFMASERQEVLNRESSKFQEDSNEQSENVNLFGVNKEENLKTATSTRSINVSDRWGTGTAKISHIKTMGKDGVERDVFYTGDSIIIAIDYSVKQVIENAVIGFSFSRNDGVYCYGTNTQIDRLAPYNMDQSKQVKILLEEMSLLPGEYFLDFEIKDISGTTMDYIRKGKKIEMVSDLSDVGIYRMKHSWLFDTV